MNNEEKTMRVKVIALTLLSLFLSSCAEIDQFMKESHERWVSKFCNMNAAYQMGLEDGLRPDRNPYFGNCPANNEALNAAYLRGFTEGLRGRPQEVTINKNVNITK